jgi:enoyl-CoA hydratase
VIAAVEGFALAGGTEILQGTDIRVAGESARFGVTEVQRGLFPMAGSTVRLPRQIPYTLALEMLLTGESHSAAECKAMGLIGRVVPDGQALAVAREIAERARDGRHARERSLRAEGDGDRDSRLQLRGREGRTARLPGEAHARL